MKEKIRRLDLLTLRTSFNQKKKKIKVKEQATF